MNKEQIGKRMRGMDYNAEFQGRALNRENETKSRVYLPHGRDPALGEDEYYVLNNADEVRRVRLAAMVRREGYPRPVCETVGIKSGDLFLNRLEADGCYRFGQLYDNAEDCAARTHDDYDYWERLRRMEEAAAAFGGR